MISVHQADQLIKENICHGAHEVISLKDAVGKILMQDIRAEREHPPFHRVAMDGIAIHLDSHNNHSSQKQFTVQGIQKAGNPRQTMLDLTGAYEVMTGAVLPANCDCVIRYEDTIIKENIATLREGLVLNKMQNVHLQGSDFKQNDLLLVKATRITAPMVATIASQGIGQILVKKAPRIAIISTGDELVDFGTTPLEHQIRRSNSYAIEAQLRLYGVKEIELFHLPDDPENIHKNLRKILADFEWIILSGGVSMGKFDYIPTALASLDVQKVFHKISQRPGKPMWFGKGAGGQNVFALPGNPVSALICLRRYVIGMLDFPEIESNATKVCLGEKVVFKKKLTRFQPVKIAMPKNSHRVAWPLADNGSGDYAALGKSDGFIELDKDQDEFLAGEFYPYYPWGNC